ncbi:MAG: sulfide/dihydroorotate dehydrogenase-like FAD/NAD-binding protein, partial [Bacillota bacterium]|nr:sulfide/dihydroorotate dehydrogenase-like FAD/NAD-binding protein [Bacillota bacterium]
MSRSKNSCIDAGTENCPCYLAVTGDCLTCSRLQGKDCSDCDWRGVCIYNEFVQGNRKVNGPRTETEVKIVSVRFYTEDLAVLVLQTGRGMALKGRRPGSYVFLRRPGAPHFFDAPLSIMRSDTENGLLHLAVKEAGTKTRELLSAREGETLLLRGIYRNGILGLDGLEYAQSAG